MRLSATARLIVVLTCLCASAGGARAQDCGPSGVGLVVRPVAGGVLYPPPLDSVSCTPLPTREPDLHVQRWTFDARELPRSADSVVALLWNGQGSRRIEVNDVVLREGGREMRLRLKVRVDTRREPGPSSFVVDLPPFQEGTFALSWDGKPAGRWTLRLVPASHWRRVDAAGGATHRHRPPDAPAPPDR